MGKARRGEMVRTALRLLGYQIGFGFFGFMVTPALIGSSAMLRVPLIGLLIAAAALLMFNEGAYRGERDCGMSETLDKLVAKGNYTASPVENAKRYSRMKGVLIAALGALPVVLLSIYVAVTAVPYAYSPQDLPGWLASYLPRAEIGDALVYAQGVSYSAGIGDYVRIAVRFILFPYVGLLGEMGDSASLMFDRVSPLLALIMPAVAAIGYQFGPSRRAKSVKALEDAKNKPRKRLKKEAKKRLSTPKEPKQLV